MTIKPGDLYNEEIVDQSLKILFNTGLFADVAIRYEKSGLVVFVVENPIINRVDFEGNKALKTDKFEEEVELRPRSVYTRSKVQADVQRLVELYRRSGRFSSKIEPKVIRQPQNRVDLIFEISEGPTTGVSSINFLGKDLGRGLTNSVFGRIETAFFHLIRGFGVDPHRGVDGGMQVFYGERFLYGLMGWFIFGFSINKTARSNFREYFFRDGKHFQ